MKKQIANINEYLKENDIKPSYTRIRIYEYLIKNKNHPTVDMIYKTLKEEIVTLSKTTVYNTLHLFIEKGITQIITIEENNARYDADTSVHGHFICEKCGGVYDFDVKVDEKDKALLEGTIIKEKHVYYRGICNNFFKTKCELM